MSFFNKNGYLAILLACLSIRLMAMDTTKNELLLAAISKRDVSGVESLLINGASVGKALKLVIDGAQKNKPIAAGDPCDKFSSWVITKQLVELVAPKSSLSVIEKAINYVPKVIAINEHFKLATKQAFRDNIVNPLKAVQKQKKSQKKLRESNEKKRQREQEVEHPVKRQKLADTRLYYNHAIVLNLLKRGYSYDVAMAICTGKLLISNTDFAHKGNDYQQNSFEEMQIDDESGDDFKLTGKYRISSHLRSSTGGRLRSSYQQYY